jgi:hypothetical protein
MRFFVKRMHLEAPQETSRTNAKAGSIWGNRPPLPLKVLGMNGETMTEFRPETRFKGTDLGAKSQGLDYRFNPKDHVAAEGLGWPCDLRQASAFRPTAKLRPKPPPAEMAMECQREWTIRTHTIGAKDVRIESEGPLQMNRLGGRFLIAGINEA